jgi:IS1 family transposase/transposase-like protein
MGINDYFCKMKLTIILHCPQCHSTNITRNGNKINKKQNYICKDCKRQFIGDHNLTYKGCHSCIATKIKKMLVRGLGVRDIAYIEGISPFNVLSVLLESAYKIIPRKNHYDNLEVDEFWSYVGSKKNKLWLIYAYDRASKEIVSYVWGKRNLKTALKLRQELLDLGITYSSIFSDNWKSFKIVFSGLNHIVGKGNTVGIEGNNCLLRHRIRRAFRRTCCFSKKLINHLKAFDLAFYYINYATIE